METAAWDLIRGTLGPGPRGCAGIILFPARRLGAHVAPSQTSCTSVPVCQPHQAGATGGEGVVF